MCVADTKPSLSIYRLPNSTTHRVKERIYTFPRRNEQDKHRIRIRCPGQCKAPPSSIPLFRPVPALLLLASTYLGHLCCDFATFPKCQVPQIRTQNRVRVLILLLIIPFRHRSCLSDGHCHCTHGTHRAASFVSDSRFLNYRRFPGAPGRPPRPLAGSALARSAAPAPPQDGRSTIGGLFELSRLFEVVAWR